MRKILLVENEPFLSGIYAQKLRERGYEIVQAVNSKNALEHFHGDSFHLVILSIAMPEIDGIVILQNIRAHKDINRSSTPVVLVGPVGDSEHLELAMEHGANEYLNKAEHHPEELIRKILRHLHV